MLVKSLGILIILAGFLIFEINAVCNNVTEFTCSDGSCILHANKCNQVYDCRNGEDENDCETCDGFQCDNGVCIVSEKRCDQVADCLNGEDEEFCIEESNVSPTVTCSTNEFRCGDGSCINNEFVCDRVLDCQDFLDEDPAICSQQNN
ncbi:hypothetical protein ACKWTF_008936 [Chironomus riparius]